MARAWRLFLLANEAEISPFKTHDIGHHCISFPRDPLSQGYGVRYGCGETPLWKLESRKPAYYYTAVLSTPLSCTMVTGKSFVNVALSQLLYCRHNTAHDPL